MQKPALVSPVTSHVCAMACETFIVFIYIYTEITIFIKYIGEGGFPRQFLFVFKDEKDFVIQQCKCN